MSSVRSGHSQAVVNDARSDRASAREAKKVALVAAEAAREEAAVKAAIAAAAMQELLRHGSDLSEEDEETTPEPVRGDTGGVSLGLRGVRGRRNSDESVGHVELASVGRAEVSGSGRPASAREQFMGAAARSSGSLYREDVHAITVEVPVVVPLHTVVGGSTLAGSRQSHVHSVSAAFGTPLSQFQQGGAARTLKPTGYLNPAHVAEVWNQAGPSADRGLNINLTPTHMVFRERQSEAHEAGRVTSMDVRAQHVQRARAGQSCAEGRMLEKPQVVDAGCKQVGCYSQSVSSASSRSDNNVAGLTKAITQLVSSMAANRKGEPVERQERRLAVQGSIGEFTAGKGAVECVRFARAMRAWYSINAALCDSAFGDATMATQIVVSCHKPQARSFLRGNLTRLWAAVPGTSVVLAKAFISANPLSEGDAKSLLLQAKDQQRADRGVQRSEVCPPLVMAWVRIVSKELGKPTAEERGAVTTSLRQGQKSLLDLHVAAQESAVAFAERLLASCEVLRIIGEEAAEWASHYDVVSMYLHGLSPSLGAELMQWGRGKDWENLLPRERVLKYATYAERLVAHDEDAKLRADGFKAGQLAEARRERPTDQRQSDVRSQKRPVIAPGGGDRRVWEDRCGNCGSSTHPTRECSHAPMMDRRDQQCDQSPVRGGEGRQQNQGPWHQQYAQSPVRGGGGLVNTQYPRAGPHGEPSQQRQVVHFEEPVSSRRDGGDGQKGSSQTQLQQKPGVLAVVEGAGEIVECVVPYESGSPAWEQMIAEATLVTKEVRGQAPSVRFPVSFVAGAVVQASKQPAFLPTVEDTIAGLSKLAVEVRLGADMIAGLQSRVTALEAASGNDKADAPSCLSQAETRVGDSGLPYCVNPGDDLAACVGVMVNGQFRVAVTTVGPDNCGGVSVITREQVDKWGLTDKVQWGQTAVATAGALLQPMEGRVQLEIIFGYGHQHSFSIVEWAVVVSGSSLFTFLVSNKVLRRVPHSMPGGLLGTGLIFNPKDKPLRIPQQFGKPRDVTLAGVCVIGGGAAGAESGKRISMECVVHGEKEPAGSAARPSRRSILSEGSVSYVAEEDTFSSGSRSRFEQARTVAPCQPVVALEERSKRCGACGVWGRLILSCQATEQVNAAWQSKRAAANQVGEAVRRCQVAEGLTGVPMAGDTSQAAVEGHVSLVEGLAGVSMGSYAGQCGRRFKETGRAEGMRIAMRWPTPSAGRRKGWQDEVVKPPPQVPRSALGNVGVAGLRAAQQQRGMRPSGLPGLQAGGAAECVLPVGRTARRPCVMRVARIFIFLAWIHPWQWRPRGDDDAVQFTRQSRLW